MTGPTFYRMNSLGRKTERMPKVDQRQHSLFNEDKSDSIEETAVSEY